MQMVTRTLRPSETLFEEGTTGRELFIIAEGKVGIYKNTPEGPIELAQIGKGSIIGEMSLLDNLPRSATVKAIEETKTTIVNQLVFQEALSKVPMWLTSIIKIIVSRLRDANKRVDQSVLRDKELGIVSLMLLMLPGSKYEFGGGIALDYDTVLVEAYYVCRLKKKEIIRLLSTIDKRKIIEIAEDTDHKKHLCIRDLEAIRLFEEFLTLKLQQKTFKELAIPDEAVSILSNIAYVAQKSGVETDEGTMLSKSALIADLSHVKPDALEKSLLDLARRNLINTNPGEHDEVTIVFKPETLSRIKKIKEWAPRFQMTVTL